ECYERAKQILQEHADKVHLLANALLKYETLDREQITELLETGKLSKDPLGSGDDEQEDSAKEAADSSDVKVNIQQQSSGNEANKLDFDRVKKDNAPADEADQQEPAQDRSGEGDPDPNNKE